MQRWLPSSERISAVLISSRFASPFIEARKTNLRPGRGADEGSEQTGRSDELRAADELSDGHLPAVYVRLNVPVPFHANARGSGRAALGSRPGRVDPCDRHVDGLCARCRPHWRAASVDSGAQTGVSLCDARESAFSALLWLGTEGCGALDLLLTVLSEI